ncbi:MAG: cysteine desulfurase [Candidatus Woesearchaeota archaeon]
MTTDTIISDFPILSENPELHYLDNAATTQKPKQVILALSDFYSRKNANAHRAVYALAEQATDLYENARFVVADFFGAQPNEIIFTGGATDSLNRIARMLRETINKGDEILLSEMEHHSNLVPWQELAKERNAKLVWIPVEHDKPISPDDVRAKITKKTKIVALTHVSNTLGTLNPINEISQIVHKYNALLVVDGAQSAPHIPIDLSTLGADFFVCSAHKMLGPMGIGMLWARKELLEKFPPSVFGGNMILNVTKEKSTWNELPWKREAGTPNVAGAVGFAAAISYMDMVGITQVQKHERMLVEYLDERLAEIGVKSYGPPDRIAVTSFNLPGIHAHDVATIIAEKNICIRAGHHCTMPLLESMQIPATCRVSFSIYNTKKDVDALIAGLKDAMEVFS